ncbi:MAG TPA: hypothetical protein VHZ07_10730 [Bryobacteraceae bacterium]|jgi:hypothetical protein|nr:hypothetical protein [Bryobacteraceae bacterium]
MRGVSILVLLLGAVFPAFGHIGSPDVFFEGKAGPYPVFITIRPPMVIPGVAQVEVRSEAPGIHGMHATPMPMAGPGARFAPTPDALVRSTQDPQFFTGSLWMMSSGSWQVRVSVDGPQGPGTLSVPIPSVALGLKKMQPGLAFLLLGLMTFLVMGLVAMVGASAREAQLAPGAVASATEKRHGRAAMGIAALAIGGALWFGHHWWASSESEYGQNVYKPLKMTATLLPNSVLRLQLKDPGWRAFRKTDDLIPDHNHIMHLYVIREPGLDVVYHLHPELVGDADFRLPLPSMPSGTYRLYADIVHASGFPETMVATIELPAVDGRPLSGDDAFGQAASWNQSTPSTAFRLPDGYTMQWERGDRPLRAREAAVYKFRLLDSSGQPPNDMAFYMGMLGHAAFVKTDGTVFAHIHPSGSVSMAALMLTGNHTDAAMPMPMAPMHDGRKDMPEGLPNEVGFPYGFPTPGTYRIFVQMKHGATVETGIFDATVN